MIVRTCTIKKYDDECSICELHRVKNNYNVKLIFDHDDLFVDFKLALNEAPEMAIKIFEEECLNRFYILCKKLSRQILLYHRLQKRLHFQIFSLIFLNKTF